MTFDADDKVIVGRVLNADDIDFHRGPASGQMMLRNRADWSRRGVEGGCPHWYELEQVGKADGV